MSQKIMQELSEHFIRRMRNWARAGAGLDSSSAYAQTNLLGTGGSGGGYREAAIPVLGGEADDVERALSTLQIRFSQAVMLFWQYEGRTLAYLAQRCAVDYRTYKGRVIDGHELLKAEMARQSEKWREYRQAVENNPLDKLALQV